MLNTSMWRNVLGVTRPVTPAKYTQRHTIESEVRDSAGPLNPRRRGAACPYDNAEAAETVGNRLGGQGPSTGRLECVIVHTERMHGKNGARAPKTTAATHLRFDDEPTIG